MFKKKLFKTKKDWSFEWLRKMSDFLVFLQKDVLKRKQRGTKLTFLSVKMLILKNLT